jgi:large subunit ribosomal protein L23
MRPIVLNPIATEKAVRLMESENKLLFKVGKKSTKKEIKQELEKEYKIKIISINTLITKRGTKKAYVKLSKETAAIDIATQMGLL